LSIARPVGAALAALHLAGRGYAPTRANALGPDGWAPLLARCLNGPDNDTEKDEADDVAPGLGRELETALGARILADCRGVCRPHIHADLFPDQRLLLDGALSG